MIYLKKDYKELIDKHANDILSNEKYQKQKKFMQHGKTSVLEHEMNVTLYALYLADKLKLKIDERSLIRGSLLHDYFLYDWHIPDKTHRLHGFTHAKTAMINANQDFNLNKIERNMISSHMFPMNLRIPIYKESILLCLSDKIIATKETIKRK